MEDLNPQGVRFRVQALTELAGDVAFVQAATRVMNIVSAAEKKGETFLSTLEGLTLDSETGEALRTRVGALSFDARLLDDLRSLPEPIKAFFEGTMIMAEDAAVRASRLSLLAYIRAQLLKVGDFTKLVTEG